MRMRLTCTGGFAGPAGAQTRTVDLDRLPHDQAEQIQSIMQACDLFALPEQLIKPAPKPWDFQYDLELDQGGQTHKVRYHLDAAPPLLKALTEKISEDVDPD
ncbi:MAG: protealysin inhibitor emfourin [Duganella sp.]